MRRQRELAREARLLAGLADYVEVEPRSGRGARVHGRVDGADETVGRVVAMTIVTWIAWG